jgi:hypothetical protein
LCIKPLEKQLKRRFCSTPNANQLLKLIDCTASAG